MTLTPAQLTRLAEADGWKFHPSKDDGRGNARPEWWESPDSENAVHELPPDYSTHPAIADLIRKQPEEVQRRYGRNICARMLPGAIPFSDAAAAIGLSISLASPTDMALALLDALPPQ